MSSPNAKPLLDLDTLNTRPVIAIDGTKYEILNPDELSVIESHRFGQWGKRIEALADKTGEEDDAELDDLIRRTARKIMVGVPDEVFDKLPGAQRWAVIDLFTGLLLRSKLKVVGAMKAAMGEDPLTGESTFPGSSGSSAAHLQTGFMARLRRWFGLT